jgi:hypothetical protein
MEEKMIKTDLDLTEFIKAETRTQIEKSYQKELEKIEKSENGGFYKEGDKVKFNLNSFTNAPDFASFSDEYVSFVVNSVKNETIFTVSYIGVPSEYKSPPMLLVTFLEDKKPYNLKYLNYIGYLDYAEGKFSENNK